MVLVDIINGAYGNGLNGSDTKQELQDRWAGLWWVPMKRWDVESLAG